MILQKALEGSTEKGRERPCRPSVRPQIDALNVSAGQAHASMAAEVSVPAVRLLLLYRGGFAGLVSLTSQKWMCRWVTVTGVSLGPRIW